MGSGEDWNMLGGAGEAILKVFCQDGQQRGSMSVYLPSVSIFTPPTHTHTDLFAAHYDPRL